MTTFTQYFFINETLVDSTERKEIFLHGSITHPYSELIYCDTCGEVYAKCPVVSKVSGKEFPWVASRLRCSKCPPDQSHWQWSGSILLSWDKDFMEALPLKIWQREAKIHTDLYNLYEENYCG